MKTPRDKAACTTISSGGVNDDTYTHVIVAGGQTTKNSGGPTNSVEIFIIKDNLWKPGPSLPQNIAKAALVAGDGTTAAAFLVGGTRGQTDSFKSLDLIYKLSIDLARWTLFSPKLAKPRRAHIAITIPKSVIGCGQ